MLKKIIITGLVVLLIFSFGNTVSAEFWGCFTKGNFIDFCNPAVPDRTCGSDLCKFCMSSFEQPPGCYNGGNFNVCNGLPSEEQGCTFLGSNATIDSQPPAINLTSPSAFNDSVFKSRAVEVIYSLNEKSNVYIFDSRVGRWSKICNECSGKVKHLRGFNEGFNELRLKAVDVVGNEAFAIASFFVDSRIPRIVRTNPLFGFASGNFNVQFMEENPQNLILTYGNSFRSQGVDLSACQESRGIISCDISADLSEFDGKNILYWFNLTDIAGSNVASRPLELSVDISAPIVNGVDFVKLGRNVNFEISIDEANLKDVSYLDRADPGARWIRICSRLDNGICRGRGIFADGFHSLVINVTDLVGNYATQEVAFFTDSIIPRLLRTEPSRGFANGIFNVQFTEQNPISLLLTYGNSFRTQELNLNTCGNDGRGTKTCSASVDLSDFDGRSILYWFNLTDIVGNKVASRPISLSVDISKPVINKIDYNTIGRTVNLDINITELHLRSVRYIDNNDPRGRWTTICSRLNNGMCRGRAFFVDGQHNLVINVTDHAGNYASEGLSFFTDSLAPRILRTNPLSGFADGTFNVEFMEANPELLFLNYGNLLTGFRNEIVDTNDSCSMQFGRYQCNALVDLDDFDGQEIMYWFNLSDVLRQTASSRRTSLDVDTTFPIIDDLDFEIVGRVVNFEFFITEENFDSVEYRDNSDIRPFWRPLCTRLTDGMCRARAFFRAGSHDLDIQVTDQAGNAVGVGIEVNIV
jgi:hypothetical protein